MLPQKSNIYEMQTFCTQLIQYAHTKKRHISNYFLSQRVQIFLIGQAYKNIVDENIAICKFRSLPPSIFSSASMFKPLAILASWPNYSGVFPCYVKDRCLKKNTKITNNIQNTHKRNEHMHWSKCVSTDFLK